MGNNLLTPEEVAARLQISRLTVMAYLRSGTLKGIKVGRLWRVDEAELRTFLSARTPGGASLAKDAAPRTAASPLYPREQAVSFATDEGGSGWLDAEVLGPLPEWDWGPKGKPPGRPVRYVPGVGLVIEGGKPGGE